MKATTQHTDRVIGGRLHMTTEVACPHCQVLCVYRHSDSHYSVGQWYGCQHLAAQEFDDTGLIEAAHFNTLEELT
jgi:hypothetical protein